MRIAVICHGNIARSQILHHYLAKALADLGVQAEVFSCGLAPAKAYPNAEELLEEVRRELARRGLKAIVQRTPWSQDAARGIEASDVILVAGNQCRAELLDRTRVAPEKVFLFYEYIGEGRKDFTDTFDPATRRQDPARFAACFDELARIAELIARRLGRGSQACL